MPWSTIISSDTVVAIHAALVPTANGDGEILLLGGDNHYHGGAVANQFDNTRRFNCRNPTSALIYVQSPSFDLFCSGHAQLPEGGVCSLDGQMNSRRRQMHHMIFILPVIDMRLFRIHEAFAVTPD